MTSASPQHSGTTTTHTASAQQLIGNEPRAARLTKTLIWPLMALHLLSTLVGFISMKSQDASEYFAEVLPPGQSKSMTPELLETMFTASIVFFLTFGVINAVIFAVVGLGLRANRTWARFIGLILAVLFVLISAYTLLIATNYGGLQGLELFSTILSWAIVVVTLVWIIQAMQSQTTVWFALHRRSRS